MEYTNPPPDHCLCCSIWSVLLVSTEVQMKEILWGHHPAPSGICHYHGVSNDCLYHSLLRHRLRTLRNTCSQSTPPQVGLFQRRNWIIVVAWIPLDAAQLHTVDDVGPGIQLPSLYGWVESVAAQQIRNGLRFLCTQQVS